MINSFIGCKVNRLIRGELGILAERAESGELIIDDSVLYELDKTIRNSDQNVAILGDGRDELLSVLKSRGSINNRLLFNDEDRHSFMEAVLNNHEELLFSGYSSSASQLCYLMVIWGKELRPMSSEDDIFNRSRESIDMVVSCFKQRDNNFRVISIWKKSIRILISCSFHEGSQDY